MGMLQDRRALVTGGTTGLGLAIATAHLGGLDVLVNNAGIGVAARQQDR